MTASISARIAKISPARRTAVFSFSPTATSLVRAASAFHNYQELKMTAEAGYAGALSTDRRAQGEAVAACYSDLLLAHQAGVRTPYR